jgi:hypothetical protein
MRISDLDLNDILNQLNSEKAYTKYADDIIQSEFSKVKSEILQEFNQHPITVEIEGGIYATNISNTLSGITNLFSFIGFEANDKPIEPIRNLLEKSTMRKNYGRRSQISYTFEIPTAKDIFLSTPLPWAVGRSWAKGIEQGLSGLGYYLKKTQNSRSGLGIQSQKIIRPQYRFKNIQYISALINKYNQRIREIEKKYNL